MRSQTRNCSPSLEEERRPPGGVVCLALSLGVKWGQRSVSLSCASAGFKDKRKSFIFRVTGNTVSSESGPKLASVPKKQPLVLEINDFILILGLILAKLRLCSHDIMTVFLQYWNLSLYAPIFASLFSKCAIFFPSDFSAWPNRRFKATHSHLMYSPLLPVSCPPPYISQHSKRKSFVTVNVCHVGEGNVDSATSVIRVKRFERLRYF